MTERSSANPRLIKTPIHGIPIGEALKSSDGHISLRIKKPKAPEYEDLPLDQFLAMVMAGAEQQITNQ